MGEVVDGRRPRRLARLALLCALAAVAVIAFTGPHGLLVLLAQFVGLALMAAGAWWAITRRALLRIAGAALAVSAPVAVIVLAYAAEVLLFAAIGLALWLAGLACARAALRAARPPRPMPVREVPPPRRPVLIMNPSSGGGKVERFDLVRRAEDLGARVVLLDTSGRQDVAELARRAVTEGADLLGVAGGDGTQALVAAVAAEHDLPFLVVSAGTRNHFAMDLGLDRADPASCLDALRDGVELAVDLGRVGDRTFVNTVSFGAYAQIVQSPQYRDAKTATALDTLPDLLLGESGAKLTARADDHRIDAPQALLVSNNPYAAPDPVDLGRRPRLDGGVLGVLGIRVDGAAQAAELVLRGDRAAGLRLLSARRVTVEADVPEIPVAVDGEALTLPTPVICTLLHRALRVRVPRDRPGANPAQQAHAHRLDWRDVARLALGRTASSRTGGR
ncbi:diacylglycerol/lipid kinase family protein [Kitasatospora cathayae]|uniref:Diacylglycerol kinase family protein n=1 Tax=Kitasatospora cathayae TaxID=3004092 RepID=A0ABY7Q0G4_9ACTN|nr:diacylglycerol kinase family protein [Kitasatospora sp. HUAS 3-15]WBP86129.1 diacylglycerol kinase family protein [Kitasatospora sp. HUAS 3-15]